MLSLSDPRPESEVRRASLSDGYNVSANCLMNTKIAVEFLQNPIIKVVKWRLIRYENTECLHVMEFTIVHNSLNFPLLGKPIKLIQCVPLLPKTTFEENVEKDGVLIPGRVVNSIIDRIMLSIREHHINVRDESTAALEESKTSMLDSTEWNRIVHQTKLATWTRVRD